MAKTVTGNVIDLGHVAAVNSTLRFVYKSAPAIVDGAVVVSGVDKTVKVSIDGTFSVVLTAGYYQVQIVDSPTDSFLILVDNVTEAVDIAEITVDDLDDIPATAVPPNASSTAAGLVKTTKTTAIPIVPTGVWHVANVAAMKAIVTNAGNTFCTLLTRAAGEPPFFYWDNTSASADDTVGFTVVKPTDNPATGRWIQFTF